MKLHEIVTLLRETGSTLEKQAILERNKHNDALKKLFFMTENPHLNYYIKAETDVKSKGDLELDVSILDDVIDTLHNRRLTGNDARAYVRELTESLTKEGGDLFVKMINRDLDCKTGTGILNKVWKGLIPEMPCMLASKMDEKAAERVVYKKDGYIIQCLSADWELVFEDGITRTIQEIVMENIFGKVMSYDENSGKRVWRNILNHFDNGESSEDWYTIRYEDEGVIKTTRPLTGNHKIYTKNRGWVRVDSLTGLDEVESL